MRGRFRIFVLAVVVLMLDAPAGRAADLDRSAVDFTPPSEIKWVPGSVRAPAGSYVIHYGGKVHYDGAKNEETIIQVWGMGPATATPAEKR
jgi:hypothetical protein